MSERPFVFGAKQIEKILPHRYPFLLVDRVLYMNLEENEIIGVKNVTVNEPFFQGHFPGAPIMPGVLQLEAMAQVAGILLLKRIEAANQLAYFMAAEEVKWRKPVLPGDVLIIEVEMTKIRGKIGKAKGVVIFDAGAGRAQSLQHARARLPQNVEHADRSIWPLAAKAGGAGIDDPRVMRQQI